MRRHTYRGEAQRKAICTASGFPTEVHAGRAADYLKSPRYLWATVRSHFWFECGMPGRYCHFPDHSTGRVRYTGSSTTPEYIRTFPPSPRRKRSVTCFFVLPGNPDVERPSGCSLKLVVSATSVSPSQCPTEWPCRNVWLAGGCLRPSR